MTIVLPAVDAEDVVAGTIVALRTGLTAVAPLEIVVVDDGSSDGTAAAARRAGADIVIVHARNQGKGAAVRTGLAASRGRTVVFTDVDLSYAPDQIVRVVQAVEEGADVAIGSRAHPDAPVIDDPRPLRKLASRPFNTATRLALGHTYADTQCGLKAFTSAAAHTMARELRIDGFAFDVELLHLAERHQMRIVEVPVRVTHSPRSSVRLAVHVPHMLYDVLRVWRSERRGRYGRNGPAAAPDVTPNP